MPDIVGIVEERVVAEKEIVWKIPNFFSVAENKTYIRCPTFAFADISWFLGLISKSSLKPGFMCYYIHNSALHRGSLEYDFGIKKHDGSVEHLANGIINNAWQSASHFTELSKIDQRKSELVPSDVLTITCILRRITTQSNQPKMLESPKVEKLTSK